MPAFLEDQAGPVQLREVEGQRRVRDAERLGDGAGGQARVARLDEPAEQGEAVLLREGGEGGDGVGGFHPAFLIST